MGNYNIISEDDRNHLNEVFKCSRELANEEEETSPSKPSKKLEGVPCKYHPDGICDNTFVEYMDGYPAEFGQCAITNDCIHYYSSGNV